MVGDNTYYTFILKPKYTSLYTLYYNIRPNIWGNVEKKCYSKIELSIFEFLANTSRTFYWNAQKKIQL